MKILVTVGAQMSFERLTESVDEWAASHSEHTYLAQIGPSARETRHMPWKRMLDAALYQQEVAQADLVVAHAGMGSILTALYLNKPILVMPRRGYLRETRNDHQIATAKRLGELDYVSVAMNTDELRNWLDRPHLIAKGRKISKYASQELTAAIRNFIQ